MQNTAALTLAGPAVNIPVGDAPPSIGAEWGDRLRRLRDSKAAARALKASPGLLALGASGAMTVALFRFWETVGSLGTWSYLGIFIAELANSASILIPLPAHNYALALSLTLNPWFLGLAGGIGAGLGEVTGYLVGASGRNGGITENRFMKKFEGIINRRLGLSLFVFSAVPAPFDFAGMVAGAVGYPINRFLLLVTAGKVLKITGITLAGYYGLRWIMP